MTAKVTKEKVELYGVRAEREGGKEGEKEEGGIYSASVTKLTAEG